MKDNRNNQFPKKLNSQKENNFISNRNNQSCLHFLLNDQALRLLDFKKIVYPLSNRRNSTVNRMSWDLRLQHRPKYNLTMHSLDYLVHHHLSRNILPLSSPNPSLFSKKMKNLRITNSEAVATKMITSCEKLQAKPYLLI